MSEPFPSTWRDTPKNRERWQRLQVTSAFLQAEACRAGGVLRCHYCHAGPLRVYHWSENAASAYDVATADHVVPRSRGGADDASNMVVACRPCNAAKADRLVL